MSNLTLNAAVEMIRAGRSASLSRAAGALIGCPNGAWAETTQARSHLIDDLPPRDERTFNASEFIARVYRLNHADKYESAI